MSVKSEDIKPVGLVNAAMDGWASLGTPKSELCLDHTLPTGQSFRWVKAGDDGSAYLGVVGQRVVEIRQQGDDVQYRIVSRGPGAHPSDDAAVLSDYFNLSTCLKDLSLTWSAADDRFKSLSSVLPGARMLRQDPLECLFSFICSSNNHISRIHGMVTRLCGYGTPLPAVPGCDTQFHAFPSLDQLQGATEEDLRAAGFGYRARYIVGTVQELMDKKEGGQEWLMGLRKASYKDAQEALCSLPGVGPKVAACVCLFSLDKHEAIPVDTHVWQLATKYYAKHLRGKTLTPKLHDEVQAAFMGVFGSYAGWAHNTLFISELASVKKKLEEATSSDEEYSGPDDDDVSEVSGEVIGADADYVVAIKGEEVTGVNGGVNPPTPAGGEGVPLTRSKATLKTKRRRT